MTQETIQEQIAYYKARAKEYDEWFYRIGRYDRGSEINQRWFDDAAVLRNVVQQVGTVESVLELACGTGIWTQELVKIGKQITAIDASQEMIEINRQKLNNAPNVEYRQLDLFSWQPDKQYDLVFFSFWLSHVPPTEVDTFLSNVYNSVLPGGKVMIIDSYFEITSSAKDHLLENNGIYQNRKLNDEREFQIFKIYYQPDVLVNELTQAGFQAETRLTDTYFIYAQGIKL